MPDSASLPVETCEIRERLLEFEKLSRAMAEHLEQPFEARQNLANGALTMQRERLHHQSTCSTCVRLGFAEGLRPQEENFRHQEVCPLCSGGRRLAMGRYRKIDTRIWNDAKFMALSERGKLVFFFGLTHPNMTMLGAMRATVPGLAAEYGISEKDFREAFQEALSKGMAKHDEKACFVWFPNFLKYNKPESPNVVKSWLDAFDLLPECEMKAQLFEQVKAFTEGLTEAFAKAFQEAFPKTMANQEQEQEQEHITPSALMPVIPSGSSNSRQKPRPSSFALPEWISPETWDGFEEMRRKIRAPLTDRARKNIVSKLDKLRGDGNPSEEVLQQSITNSWRDVFELRDNRRSGNSVVKQSYSAVNPLAGVKFANAEEFHAN